MLNGAITINDTAGGGATFTVKFPLKQIKACRS